MTADKTIAALAALAHEHRLAAYRLLVETGPNGLSAGLVAERLGIPPSSLTSSAAAVSCRADYPAAIEPSAHLCGEFRDDEHARGVSHRELLRPGRERCLRYAYV